MEMDDSLSRKQAILLSIVEYIEHTNLCKVENACAIHLHGMEMNGSSSFLYR